MRKINNALLLIACILITSLTAFSQSNNVRGMYIKDIDDWLGDTSEENDILAYAQSAGFTYINFYDLSSLNFGSSTMKNNLAAFIHKAKTQYGISEVGAVGETAGFFSGKIIPYNNGRSRSSEKFDILNLEFEFWVTSTITSQYCSRYLSPNGYSCDKSGAYKFAKKEFQAIHALAQANGLLSEIYLGWPERAQMQDVANTMDRILLHSYRPTDSDVYSYSRNRLIDAASVQKSVKIIPLFSAESSFMGPWLNSNPVSKPYQTYSSHYTAESGSWKQYIKLQGYHWFTYDDIPKNSSAATATITAGGPTTFCTGGSVTLTANSGSAYKWYPGNQTTKSITVTSSGSYSVRVTNSSGASATSSAVNVTVSSSGATPTISASGSLTLSSSNPSVSLTSSSAATYLWSNGATTKSITVSTAGSYSVTTDDGSGCGGTSAPVVVTTSSSSCVPPAAPVITAGGSLTICQGSTLTLTSSTANGYLWSNGENTKSITVSQAGTYWVRAYVSGNCYTQSSDIVVTVSTASVPAVSASGTLNLSTSNPSVTLTSSSASSYLWTTGATTKSITVSNAGTYKVTVTNSNGCTATSASQVVTKNTCAPPPVPVIGLSGSPILQIGQSVTLTSPAAGGYLWSNGANTRSIVVSSPGAYTVRNYSGSNCFSVSEPVYIIRSSTDYSYEKANQVHARTINSFTAYPNPATEKVQLTYTSSGEKESLLIITDISGREMMRKTLYPAEGENLYELNVYDYPRGVYFANLISTDAKETVKLILQ